jgi:hypothetical protein
MHTWGIFMSLTTCFIIIAVSYAVYVVANILAIIGQVVQEREGDE